MGTQQSPAAGINQIVQTIVALKDLQLRSAAQDLARQQFGLQQQEFGLRADQMDVASREAAQSGFQNLQGLIRNTDQPSALLPFVSEFANRIGVSPQSIATIIQHTPPTTETTRGAAVAKGAEQLGGTADVAAANQALVGVLPGQLAQDALSAKLFTGAGGYLSALSQPEQQQFFSGVATRVATGLTPGQAAIDQAISNLPRPQLHQIALVGHGLAPSASDQEQARLGWAAHQIQQSQLASTSAIESLRTQAMISEAQARLGTERSSHVADLLKERDKIYQQLTTGGITLTPEGRAVGAASFNHYNELLRQTAPEMFGPKGTSPLQDVKPEGNLGITSGFVDFLGKIMR